LTYINVRFGAQWCYRAGGPACDRMPLRLYYPWPGLQKFGFK
jgi:hypothetical protein